MSPDPRTSSTGSTSGRRGLPPDDPGVRGWIAVGVAVVLVAVIGVGGSRLPVETQARSRATAAVVGRTSTICTTGSTSAATGGAAGSDRPDSLVTAVAARQSGTGSGSLTGRVLGAAGSGTPRGSLDLTTPGSGVQLEQPAGPVLLTAEGTMSVGSAGAVLVRSGSGRLRGLQTAPCVLPAVNQWLVGLGAAGGATEGTNDEIVLSNPDATDAEVDLRLYGRSGPITAAGASGITVAATSARTVSLSALTHTDGPIAVNVRASSGRVAAVAQELRTTGSDGEPAGADLHPASVAPAHRLVIPGVPGGQGSRTLTVVNPGQQRAKVAVEVLGPEGPFAPAGASQLTVGPQSTAQVDLAAGLAGQIGTVRLTGDQPVTAAVTSFSTGSDQVAADLAVTTAQPLLGRTAVGPAAVVADADTELAVSNAGSDQVVVGLTVYDLDGVSLYHEDVPVGPNSTAARRLDQPAPAYVVLTVPDRAEVYAGTTLAGALGSGADQVAGLASAGLVTPDPNARSRTVVDDPRVAR